MIDLVDIERFEASGMEELGMDCMQFWILELHHPLLGLGLSFRKMEKVLPLTRKQISVGWSELCEKFPKLVETKKKWSNYSGVDRTKLRYPRRCGDFGKIEIEDSGQHTLHGEKIVSWF